MQGWDHPFSREAMILADLFDLTNLIATDSKHRNQLKPHPSRPWKDERHERFGDTGGRSRDEVMAILTAAARGEVLTPDQALAAGRLGEWPGYQPPVQATPEPRLAANPHD